MSEKLLMSEIFTDVQISEHPKNSKSNRVLLIFDFDKSIEASLQRWGFDKTQVDNAVDIGLSLRKTLGNLGLGFLSRWMLRRQIMKDVEKYTSLIKKCKDVDSINKISEKKILVTNSLKEFALPILKHLKLKKTFDEVYGADDFSDKARFISEYIKKNNMNKKECYYIGDRAADVKLARKAGCISVVISGRCAWNSRKELIKAQPDFILDDIAQLRKIL